MASAEPVKLPSILVVDTVGKTRSFGSAAGAVAAGVTVSVAKFEITTCEVSKDTAVGTHLLSGNLTLKDSTKNVSFPISVKIEGNNVLALGKVTIDRTQWGMHYGNDESLKDKFIYPKVDISVNLVATKK